MGIDSFYGTPAMTPPEMLENLYGVGEILYKLEVWALGVCLFTFHFRQWPSWCTGLTSLGEMLIHIANLHFYAERGELTSSGKNELRELADKAKKQIDSVKQNVTATIEDKFAILSKKERLAFSDKIEFLIYSMMRQDPNNRITMRQAYLLAQEL